MGHRNQHQPACVTVTLSNPPVPYVLSFNSGMLKPPCMVVLSYVFFDVRQLPAHDEFRSASSVNLGDGEEHHYDKTEIPGMPDSHLSRLQLKFQPQDSRPQNSSM